MRKMHNFVINRELLPSISNYEDADGARATSKSFLQARPEMALVNNLETLFDFTSLSHGDKLSIFPYVNQTVLLEDRAQEGVENNRRRRMGHNTWLFMKLLGEQINSEIAMLTRLGRSGDANDLARAMLKNYQVANANVVAWDGERSAAGRVNRRDRTAGLIRRILLGFAVEDISDRSMVIMR